MEAVFDFFESVADLLDPAFDLMDLAFPFGFLLVGLLFFGIGLHLRRENQKFTNTVTAEGVIVSIRGSGESTFPTIEYERNGEKHQFLSSMAAPGAKTGQLIDIEINTAGDARIKSSSHGQMATVLLILSTVFIVFAAFIFVKE